MVELLKQVEDLHNRLLNCTSTGGRAINGWAIIDLMQKHPEIKKYWQYDDNAYRWNDRFKQIRHYMPTDTTLVENSYTIVDNCIIDPITDLRQAPEVKGLYLIGQTNFNPYTDDKQYWVKVGYSANIYRRFKGGYTTTSPCTALLDITEETDEQHCHSILKQVAIGKCQQNEEWWLVDRDTYLLICNDKFAYFGF